MWEYFATLFGWHGLYIPLYTYQSRVFVTTNFARTDMGEGDCVIQQQTSTGIDAGASKGKSWLGYSLQQSGSMLKNVGYWFQ